MKESLLRIAAGLFLLAAGLFSFWRGHFSAHKWGHGLITAKDDPYQFWAVVSIWILLGVWLICSGIVRLKK
jgi:hypothetical protein